MTTLGKRIAIVLPDLGGGGAERMHLVMAREWLLLGFEVDFVLMRKEGDLLSLVPPAADIFDLGVPRTRYALLPLRSYLKKHQPNALLVAMWPLTVVSLLAARLSGTGVRVMVSDHSILSQSYRHKNLLHRTFLRTSMALGYRLAAARISVSKGVAADASALSGIRLDQFHVVYNPAASGVDPVASKTVPPELVEVKGPLILSVGSLKAEKNHALLIDAFSRLAPFIDATLCILGEGALRIELEKIVVRYGLQGRVLLPGFRLNTAPWYARADLFVLSSRHEGFGNVIVEALEYGVPVVSTDCISGPREVLCDGKYGRLVPVGDASALAAAMQAALSELPNRNLLRARARDFAVEKIAAEYLDVMFPDWRLG